MYPRGSDFRGRPPEPATVKNPCQAPVRRQRHIPLAACASQDEKAATLHSQTPTDERPADHWLTENQAFGVLASSNPGDGVWGIMYDNPATNLEALAIRTINGWLVCSRETGGRWSTGTPFLSVDSALEAMRTGGGIKRFRTWQNGRVIDGH